METQAGVQWHPIASCLWPAQDWGQGWGVGRAAGSFLQQGPGGCWGEGAVGQESGLAGNLGKLPAILCLSFPIICEIKGLDSTVVFRSHGVLFTAEERGLGNQTRRALAPSCLPSSGLGQVSLFTPRKEVQWCSRKGATPKWPVWKHGGTRRHQGRAWPSSFPLSLWLYVHVRGCITA